MMLKVNKLQAGATFTRQVMLGLTAQELYVRLSDDTSHISWKTTKSWTGEEKGQIDLTESDLNIKSTNTHGIQFMMGAGTMIIEMNAIDTATRDEWIVAINDIRTKWKQDATTRPTSSASAAGHTDKKEYFTKKQQDIEARRKQNEEKKAKYSVNGMKFTAQILANQAN
jgi:hypothetical protein